MPIPFIMPKFDMDQENATVVEWIKHEGDHIELDEPVLTVETDKVAIEVPAPATGKLVSLSAYPGDVIPVAAVIAYVLEEGESIDDLPEVEVASSGSGAQPEAKSVAQGSPRPETVTIEADMAVVNATPVAARMAQDIGITLSEVPFTGEKVKKTDIEAYLESLSAAGPGGDIPATPAARRLSREMGIDIVQVPGSGPRNRVQADDVRTFMAFKESMVSHDGREAEMLPLVGIRKTIADRMQSSFQVAPHIALSVDVDVTHLEAARSRMNSVAEKRGDQRISVTALLIKIIAWVLENNPYVNSSLVDETIYLWKDINIGVATAIEEGLVVPVIHNSNQKSVSALNSQLKDLSSRARDGSLTLEEVKNGTFTITNLGMFGIDHFRAIINPPESAILAVGKVIRKAVVLNEKDEIGVRPLMTMTLSADHRVIDGVVAASFLQDLVAAVESPDILLY